MYQWIHLVLVDRSAYDGCRLNLVSLRKTCIIQPHALFTGIYLLKRLSAGFLVSCRASPFGAAPVFSFFASNAPPRWHNVFSQFAPVVNSAFSVLASGSNFAVKPTRLRRAAYFLSLACEKPAILKPMLYLPAFTFSSVYSLGFGFLAGLRLFSVFLQAVRRLGGTMFFRSLHPSLIQHFLFWLLGLTLQSSRPTFGGRLTFVRYISEE